MRIEKERNYTFFYPWVGDDKTYVSYNHETYVLIDMMEDIHWRLGRPVEDSELETIVISFSKALAHMLPHM